jgi:uncharacterized protein YqjF (DUF2071 family)
VTIARRAGGALEATLRQRSTLDDTGHRPWPLPDRSWFMGQTWKHLLFMHWRVEPETLMGVVPPELPLDLRDGAAWIGITPFRVEGLRLRGTPPPPVLSRFLEVNARTYVTCGGKPGIYFLSLDASSRAAVIAARRTYRLPYFRTDASCTERDGEFGFRSSRKSGDGPAADLEVAYRPVGGTLPVREESLERWLTERYCLYTLDEDRAVHRGDIHHPPWPLRAAQAEIGANSMVAGFGLELQGEPVLHYSERQDVVLWTIAPVG